MTVLAAGSVVWIAFPFVESGTRKSRPALVVSHTGLGVGADLFWAAMITGAGKMRWPGDVEIADLAKAGLPIPSIVRPAKLATLTVAEASPIGRIDDSTLAEVLCFIRARLGDGVRR